MSEQHPDVRAILVSRRDPTLVECGEAWDAAGDRPRKKVCAAHGYRDADSCVRGIRDEDGVWHPSGPCRVVDAIVCCLESVDG